MTNVWLTKCVNQKTKFGQFLADD